MDVTVTTEKGLGLHGLLVIWNQSQCLACVLCSVVPSPWAFCWARHFLAPGAKRGCSMNLGGEMKHSFCNGRAEFSSMHAVSLLLPRIWLAINHPH